MTYVSMELQLEKGVYAGLSCSHQSTTNKQWRLCYYELWQSTKMWHNTTHHTI